MWETYVTKRGSLNVGLRVEASIARLCALFSRVNGNASAKPSDYMPHFDEPESPEISLEQAMQIWK